MTIIAKFGQTHQRPEDWSALYRVATQAHQNHKTFSSRARL